MQPVPGTGAVSRAGSGNGPHSADAATTPHPPLLPCETGYGSDDPASGSRVLILLDMNGTLLYRHKRPQPILLGKNTHAEPAFVHGHPDPFHYFMRPGSREFVEAIARHPRARVAFYTSMRLENALPAARSLMSEDCRSVALCAFVLGQIERGFFFRVWHSTACRILLPTQICRGL